MDPNNDLLRPGFHLSSKSLNHSRSKWHALLSSTQSTTNLPYFCSNVKVLLNKTPSIPQSTEVAECARKNSLSLEGYSKWSVAPADKTSRGTCDLPPLKKNYPEMFVLQILIRRHATCRQNISRNGLGFNHSKSLWVTIFVRLSLAGHTSFQCG
jgi:hypothetical protein